MWVYEHFDALADFPDHQATVVESVRRWVPETLRLFVYSQAHGGFERKRAVEEALSSLDAVHAAILRIKASIVQGELTDLEARQQAMMTKISLGIEGKTKGKR